jgi:hypothetical protein
MLLHDDEHVPEELNGSSFIGPEPDMQDSDLRFFDGIQPYKGIQGAGTECTGGKRNYSDKHNKIRPRRCDHVHCKYPNEYNPENYPDHTVDHADILFTNLHISP